MRTLRLQVRMLEVLPEVVRVVDVPAASTLPELHALLQAGIGWTDSHLHQFTAGDHRYGPPITDPWDDGQQDETGVPASVLGARFGYLYDLGDGWEHRVRVLGAGGDRPGCVSGHGACPPEDVGGPHGYTGLLATLADPRHPEHQWMRDWSAGTLMPFDLAGTDSHVRHTAGTVPESVSLLLGLAAGGIRLTPGGRLPRAVVRAVQEHRPHWHYFGTPARIEEDLLPLMVLHDLLRAAGLLTLRSGVLRPARAAGDELAVVRRLRAQFPARAFTTMLAGLAIGDLVAAGPATPAQLAARLHPMLGPGWASSTGPVTETDVRTDLHRLTHTLQALDQVTVTEAPGRPHTWSAGPAAPGLLTRSALIAHHTRHPADQPADPGPQP